MSDIRILDTQSTVKNKYFIVEPRLSEDEHRHTLKKLPNYEKKNIDEFAIPLLLAGEFNEYLQSIDAISPGIIEKHPSIMVYQATAMLLSEHSCKTIKETLDKVEQVDKTKNLEGEILALRAILTSYTDDPETGIELSQRAFTRIKPDNIFFRNLLERNLGVAYTLKGDLNNANIWLEKFLMSSSKLEDWVGVVAAYNYLTFIRRIQGRLREANIIYEKALDFIESHQLTSLPHSIKIISGYGSLLLQWHRTQEAKFYFTKAIQLAKQSEPVYAFTAYQNLFETYIRENDTQNAFLVIEKLHNLSVSGNDLYEKIHTQSTQAIQARLYLHMGNLDRARQWLETSKINSASAIDLEKRYGYQLGFILPIAAQIYTAMGDTNRAIEILNAIIPKFMLQGAGSYLIRALNALAIAYHQNGQKEKALETIKKAINLGISENNLGDFVFLGINLIPLIRELYSNQIAPNYTHKLLDVLTRLNNEMQSQHRHGDDLSHLSSRELDVLKLLAKGLTNQEIAQSLFLSTNTIKSHSIKIYRKLDVNNRGQAVNKARSMGILPAAKPEIYRGYQTAQ